MIRNGHLPNSASSFWGLVIRTAAIPFQRIGRARPEQQCSASQNATHTWLVCVPQVPLTNASKDFHYADDRTRHPKGRQREKHACHRLFAPRGGRGGFLSVLPEPL